MQEIKTEIKTFVFMGRPGSGKGAQAARLSKQTGFKIFSTGDRCREISGQDSFLGRKLRRVVEGGELTPDWFASYLFEEALLPLAPEQGIIFDGLGRKESEARLFNEVCQWLHRPYQVIFLDTKEKTVRERLLKRSTEGRADDAEEAIHIRFQAYERDTEPAINFFESLGVVATVDGERDSDLRNLRRGLVAD